ncbi:MAG: CoA transferase [Pseudomonadota bacterium]|nr:CoA transferase [Pseudomonadota bacterium]
MADGNATTTSRPLEGLRVVDFSRMMSGPLATMIMADLGAHVIRVEDLEGTDTTRHNHPFVKGESHYFLSLNRNKESIAIDLKSPRGKEIALGLVKQADIVVENFRVGAAKRLGLDYESLRRTNPALVYCSVTGFGQTGPWRDKTAYDLVIQAVTGALSVTGEPGRPPAKMGLPLADQMSSLFAGIAALAGIERRDRTGLGCYLDMSMFDSGVAMLSYMASIYFVTGDSPTAQGSSHPTIYPYNAFETADGYIVVAPFTNAFWRKFCAALDLPDLPDDPKYRAFADRLENRTTLASIIDPVMKTRTTGEWVAALDKADVPNGPVSKIDEVLESEHAAARGMVVEIDHPVCGRLRCLGTPFHFEYSDGESFKPSYAPQPVVGQHTAAILKTLLGYSDGDVAKAVAEKSVRLNDVGGVTSASRRVAESPQAATAGEHASLDAPLKGVRVLDLTRMLAGPYGTLILADLGADVIKIEEPRIGDPTRRNIPMVEGESTYFMSVNRGKRGVTMDLKQPQDRKKFLELVRSADVVLENYRPGVMKRLGLSYEDLKKEKPDIILCSISGYGQTGPLHNKISFDLVNQAMAGTMSVTGEAGRPPVRVGLPAGDLGGGIFGAFGVLAALYNRRRTGRGSHIDLGLHDILVSLLGYVGQLYFTTGEVPGPVGSGHHHIAPYRAFEAKDGYFVVAAFTQIFWLKFVKAIGRPELADDARFADITARKHNKVALYEIIDPVFVTKSVDEWVEIFRLGDVPAARVNSVGEALECDHAKFRDIVFSYHHPRLGEMRAVGTPFRADGRVWRSSRPPPGLGEHNTEILGVSADQKDEDSPAALAL